MILIESNLFWSGPKHFGQVQIRLFWTIFYFFGPVQNYLEPTKTNWTRPKQLLLDQNDLDGPK